MSTIINADTSDGLKFTSDTSGEIKLQSAGADIATVNSSGVSATTFIPTSSTVPTNGVYLPTTNTVGLATNSTERMRINSNGSVSIGNTLNTSGLSITNAGANGWNINTITSSTTAHSHLIFTNGNGNVGSISSSGTSTAYNTSSDYRLKENVAPMSGSIDRLKQLKPSTWSWKLDGSHGEGFIAHEAQAVVPEAISGTKDAMRTEEYEVTPAVLDDDGNVVTEAVMGTREVPDYQGIDQAKLVPLLTAALQEAITKIEDLETRIQALENA